MKENKKAGKIVRSELGTYAEPDWISTHPDGSLIENPQEVQENRLNFLTSDGYITDNTNIQTYEIRGQIVSVSDALAINVHEPKMLRKIEKLDINQSKNFPDGLQCTMHSSHGQIDQDKTFWNVMACQCLPHTGLNHRPYPVTCYLPYKIPSLAQVPDLPILEAIEFGTLFQNSAPTKDQSIHYFHSLTQTDNYIIVPLSSLLWSSIDIVRQTMNAEPLSTALDWDTDTLGWIIDTCDSSVQ